MINVKYIGRCYYQQISVKLSLRVKTVSCAKWTLLPYFCYSCSILNETILRHWSASFLSIQVGFLSNLAKKSSGLWGWTLTWDAFFCAIITNKKSIKIPIMRYPTHALNKSKIGDAKQGWKGQCNLESWPIKRTCVDNVRESVHTHTKIHTQRKWRWQK